jgi:hypothetical protein
MQTRAAYPYSSVGTVSGLVDQQMRGSLTYAFRTARLIIRLVVRILPLLSPRRSVVVVFVRGHGMFAVLGMHMRCVVLAVVAVPSWLVVVPVVVGLLSGRR